MASERRQKQAVKLPNAGAAAELAEPPKPKLGPEEVLAPKLNPVLCSMCTKSRTGEDARSALIKPCQHANNAAQVLSNYAYLRGRRWCAKGEGHTTLKVL